MLLHLISLILNIYDLTYYISIISITSSYSQNLVYLLSGNRCDTKHQGKTSHYVLSPGQRNLFLHMQTTIIIWEVIMPKNTTRTWPIS